MRVCILNNGDQFAKTRYFIRKLKTAIDIVRGSDIMKAPKGRGGIIMSKLLNDDHGANLPTIRITEITLENFKSVKYGNIVFNCGRKFIPYGTQADILGLYGQNGSGKTSLIEALSILKHLNLAFPFQTNMLIALMLKLNMRL